MTKVIITPVPPARIHGLKPLNTATAVQFLYTQPKRFRKN